MEIIALLILGLVLVWAALVFNRLVRLRNHAQSAWADIDVQLKRRHDLVQNLVETVKAYALHERTTLEEVVRARLHASETLAAGKPGAASQAEGKLSAGMRGLLALAEAYPDLKASDRFLDLQRALVQLEEDLQNARRYYNAVVRDLNTRIQSFPDLLIARVLRFREREFFELESAAEAVAPRVEIKGGG